MIDEIRKKLITETIKQNRKGLDELKEKKDYKSILVSQETKKEFDLIKAELQISQDETLLKLIDIYKEEKLNGKS